MGKMFFSAEVCGFFDDAVHTEMPADATFVENARYQGLLHGQQDGMRISSDENGMPVLVPQPQVPDIELALTEQSRRVSVANQQISTLKPAVDGGYAKPEHTQLLADWQRCRYELTLVPEQPGWPEDPQWPTEPDKVI